VIKLLLPALTAAALLGGASCDCLLTAGRPRDHFRVSTQARYRYRFF